MMGAMDTAHVPKKHPIIRFAKSTSVGVSTFLFDLVLLFVLTDFFGMNYVIAAGLAFLVAVTLNYFISRRFVFKGTERSVHHGYLFFLGIVGTGLVFITGLMYVLVDVVGLPMLPSRILIAGVVGIWNYLMNLHFNFKVAGKH